MREIVAGLPRDRDAPRLRAVLELAVAALRGDDKPSVAKSSFKTSRTFLVAIERASDYRD